MGFFSLTHELAIDLGTANTLIVYNDEIVVEEPSVIAVDLQGKLKAFGNEAARYIGKCPDNLRTIRPLQNGVIADFDATELMLKGMIGRIKTTGSLFSPSLKMVI